MPALLGPVFGPPLGGLLTDAISWRAVFWINIPVGLIGLVLVWRFIPEVERQDPGPLDIRGLGLWGLALTLMMAGLETIGRPIAPAWFAPGALVLGTVCGALAVRHSRRVARPAVDLSLLRLPSFALNIRGGSLFRIGASTLPFLLPLKLQIAFGLSAGASGLITFGTALGAFAAKPLVRPLLKRFGFRRVLAVNTVLGAASLAVCALFTEAWPVAAIFAVLAIGGVARSLQFTSTNALSYADVPQDKLAAATSLSGTVQQLGQALGVVVGSLSLEAALFATGGTAPRDAEFAIAFIVAALLMLASVVSVVRLPRDAGARVAGHDGS
jgi:MFS family permease